MNRVAVILFFLILSGNAFASSEGDKVKCYARFYAEQYEQALTYCGRSADAGHAVGIYLLGLMYLEGLGVTADKEKGVTLLKKAADMGYSDAEKDYGQILYFGFGISKNAEKACEWWEKSALHNNMIGQNHVAGCYLNGIGREVDSVKAYAFLLLASESGYEKSKVALPYLRSKLSNEEIKNAEIIANEIKKGFK